MRHQKKEKILACSTQKLHLKRTEEKKSKYMKFISTRDPPTQKVNTEGIGFFPSNLHFIVL